MGNRAPFSVHLISIIFLVAVTLNSGHGQAPIKGKSATVSAVQKSKILIIIPLATTSEKGAFVPIANGLGERGHQVTVVSNSKTSYTSVNVKEIVISGDPMYLGNPLELRKAMGGGFLLKILSGSFNMDFSFNVMGCEKVYENPEFVNAINNEKFDLVFTNTWFHQCFLGVVAKQGIPFIYMSTMPLISYFQELTGARNPTSFVPNPMSSVTDDMDFSQRMYNTFFDHYWTYFLTGSYGPAMEAVYRKYLGEDLPSAREIEGNVSLVFSNTHLATTPPRPMMPDVIEVGGMHCRPSQPLPKDLEDFVSGGKDGFIYFSFGSMVQGQHMPEEWRIMFLNVFSRLKQRVLWKWETETMEGLPANVRLGKWLPQQDLLGHPKLRLFITHGGLFSTQEATYHGIPFLGMPVFSDQDLNMHFAQNKGYAIMIEMLTMTEEIIENSIQELLNNKTYGENAKLQSALFKDQLQHPTERAVYWTEYVLKYNGAHHLRSAARKLNFVQYHSLDVLGVLIAFLIIILYIVFAIIRKLCSIICKSSSKSAQTKKNQ